MATILNSTNIWYFVSWKCIIMWAKSDLQKINSVCKKGWFGWFFSFCLFHFSKFEMTIIKNLMKKPSFIINFESSFKVLLCHKYFWSTHFRQWNDSPFKFFFFWICREIHFVSLLFLNERNITTSHLMIYLKCTVVHYANLNSSSINKSFLNHGPLNMPFHFCRILVYLCLNEAFVKNFKKKL